jgi:hypothetical protein
MGPEGGLGGHGRGLTLGIVPPPGEIASSPRRQLPSNQPTVLVT